MKYLHQSVKVVKGREAGKIAELASDGWELTAQQSGTLRTELTFRKPQPESPLAKLLAAFLALAPATRRRIVIVAGGVAAALVLMVVVLVAVSGGDEGQDLVASDVSSESADPEPTASPTASPEPTPAPTPSATPAPEPTPDVITAKNTPEFAALLKGDDCSRDYAAFAKAYKGDKIEFDGSVVDAAPHGSFTTRFDYLLGAGDDGPNTTTGPLLRYEDVNYSDFGVTGKNQPDSLNTGDLFRFTATVEGYNPQTCLLALSPVQTEAR
ncbi:MAG: DUF4839 domain-containing protein [Nocardioides sp.]|uniref:DUF4839 domain-containing protein n=1 Tax=Nocardioides sp. TaxID=35761 RepID=UPI00238FEDBA|nr:DUF4839 domain-containing protein [Nocardioides sp.]MDE0776635.1 DUF4839 domain-containing protein [Nocardioides sp.]